MAAPKKRQEELPEIANALRRGVTIPQLAKDYGISRRALYKWLLSNMGDEKYGELVTEVLTARIADCDEGLEDADSFIEVSKYSQLGKFARMDYERRRPALYGSKQMTVNVTAVDISAELAKSMQALLDRPAEKLIGSGKAEES